MNTTTHVRNLTATEARSNAVVLRVPTGEFRPATRNTAFPEQLSGLTFTTARTAVAELNSHRMKAGRCGRWHFLRFDDSQGTFSICRCSIVSPAATIWIPASPLELPPCVVEQCGSPEEAETATRNRNGEICQITDTPKLWHAAAVRLIVPVINATPEETDSHEQQAEQFRELAVSTC